MKKILFLLCAVLVALTFFAGTSTAAKYKPGTYRGTAKGYDKPKHPGEIVVEVTVDANTIKNIKLITYKQTDKGEQGKNADKAKTEIPATILKKQSLAVDSVAKATISSIGIELAVAQALEQATVRYKDGTYTGKARGYDKPKHPGEIEVAVTITGGKISKIDLVKFNQTDKGKQGESAAQAKAEIPSAIMKKQSIAVDAVAKATISSNGIQIAVARALEQAR